LSLNICLRNDFTFNDLRFCDRQNIGISRNINNVSMHYLYQQNTTKTTSGVCPSEAASEEPATEKACEESASATPTE
jgi:tRNA A37 threonylcarbamoyltransferase TsaD